MVTKCLVGFGVQPFASIFINFLDPFFAGLYLSLVFAIAGSKLHPAGAEEKECREALLKLPESERAASEYKRDRYYGYLLIAVGIATTCFLLFGWALPYNGML